MNLAAQILIVEDDRTIATLLEASMSAAGYKPLVAPNLALALSEAQARQPDLILLDLGLPDGDGLTLIPKLREFTFVPIVVLSARGKEEDRVAALDLGADDYVPKPFSAAELHARIRAGLRRMRQAAHTGSTFAFGDVTVDFEALTVRRAGEDLHLTPIEFKLLRLLIENRGRVLTQRFLLNAVWGPQFVEHIHYLRIFMKQLRDKVEVNGARPKFIKTETGVGYRFVPIELS